MTPSTQSKNRSQDNDDVLILSGPVLGVMIASMLCITTTLYLSHDRESEPFDVAVSDRQGYWGKATGDFNWCEPDYLYSPYVVELWNSVTSFAFCVSPVVLWPLAPSHLRTNLALVMAIGLGSVAFHATLQYWAQLLDEIPMLCYIVHTVTILRLRRCPSRVGAALAVVGGILLGTVRDAAVHQIGRVVMVLGFSASFIFLAFSLAPVCTALDAKLGGKEWRVRYRWASCAVLASIIAWMLDNMACRELHTLPFGLPYPQLHAMVWHLGMAYVCHTLCSGLLALDSHPEAREAAGLSGTWYQVRPDA